MGTIIRRVTVKKFDIKDGIGMVDFDRMQINLWLTDISVSAKIGVERIIGNVLEKRRELCKVYFKGILIEAQEIINDSELLESIDILGKRSYKSMLQLSRNGFTEAGELYIHDVVIPKVFGALYDTLRHIAAQKYADTDGNAKALSMVIEEKFDGALQQALNENKADMAWKRQMLGISLFYHFYMLERGKEKSQYVSSKVNDETAEWKKTLENVWNLSEQYRKRMRHEGITDVINNMYVDVMSINHEMTEYSLDGKMEISIADFFDRENIFWVVSKRRYAGDPWVNYLICVQDGKATDRYSEISTTICIEDIQRLSMHNSKTGKSLLDDRVDGVMKQIKSNIKEEHIFEQSNLVQWIMKFVPVAANFSDFEGNTGIHILSGNPVKSVCYNQNAKYMLLKKTAERNESNNARRVAGYAWYGYEVLIVRQTKEDVCIVCENYVYENEDKMFLPWLGDTAQKVIYLSEDTEINEDKKMRKLDDIVRVENALERCVVLDLEYYKKEEKLWEVFHNAFQNFCSVNRKQIKEEEFISRMQYYYEHYLEEVSQQMDEPEDDCSLALPSIDEVKKLQQTLYEELMNRILETKNGFVYDEINEKLQKGMERLCWYCTVWIQIWEKWLYDNIQETVSEIRQKEWDDTLERKNLIEWTAKVNQMDKDAVAEWYDSLWDELEIIIGDRKKLNIIRERRFRHQDKIYRYRIGRGGKEK